MLQTRNAKRTGFAAVRIAVDLVNEGLIDAKTALEKRRIPADDLNQLLQPIFNPIAKAAASKTAAFLAKGINAGPGAATGQIVFHASDAEEKWNADNNLQLILVRKETSPEDLRGMKVAKGILTAFGGASSHAALVSRQMGKTCVCGCDKLNIDYDAATVTVVAAGRTRDRSNHLSGVAHTARATSFNPGRPHSGVRPLRPWLLRGPTLDPAYSRLRPIHRRLRGNGMFRLSRRLCVLLFMPLLPALEHRHHHLHHVPILRTQRPA